MRDELLVLLELFVERGQELEAPRVFLGYILAVYLKGVEVEVVVKGLEGGLVLLQVSLRPP